MYHFVCSSAFYMYFVYNIGLLDSYWGSCSKKKSYYINAEPNNKLGIKSCKNKDKNGININDYDGEITEEIFEVISGNV